MKKFKHEERFLNNLTEISKELFSVVELSDGHELTPELLFTKKKFSEYLEMKRFHKQFRKSNIKKSMKMR